MKKGFLSLVLLTSFISFLLFVKDSFAAHPLITDDTGTMGKGNFQAELNTEFSFDKEREDGVTIKERVNDVSTILTYGITDNVDIVAGLPYIWFRTKENGDLIADEDGIGDIFLELKWRFYEKEGISFALKPGITLPTGDEDKGLGQGRSTYSLFFITTKELEAIAIHLNLGYIRNENKHDERKDLWHVSLAGETEVLKDLKLVANIGAERNPDKSSNTHPAFILGGIIYTLSERIDIDFGIKAGLNKPETDLSILAGLVYRF